MKLRFTFACFFLLFLNSIQAQSNLYDLIKASPDHNIFGLLVDAIGYDENLKGSDTLTIYAPTDQAFAELSTAQLIGLLSNPTETVDRLVKRHSVKGVFESGDLTDGQILVALSGESLLINNSAGYFVNNVKVVSADIPATNGVLNVVESLIGIMKTGNTVADIIINSPDHTTLALALTASGADAQLREAGPFTVFAPTDAAFEALDPVLVQTLLADPTGKLATVLLYHVSIGTYTSTSLVNGQQLIMANGQRTTITKDDEGVKINGILITMADIIGENGVVHVINAVILPDLEASNTVVDKIAQSEDHTILFGALAATGLDSTLRGAGPFTVFAPTNAAFENLPQGLIEEILLSDGATNLLLNHVIEGSALSTNLFDGSSVIGLGGSSYEIFIDGSNIYVGNALITVKDIVADNGVVHVIDAVLMDEIGNTVYDVILKSPDHRILQGLLNLAQLKEDLTNEDNEFTIFAPTDAAFTNIPEEVMDQILEAGGDLILEILGRHALTGVEPSSGLFNGKVLTTISDEQIQIKTEGTDIFVNNGKIIAADVEGTNGLVHVVDAVLLPVEIVGLKVLDASAGKIYPNPAVQLLQYDFGNSFNDKVNLQVFDTKGIEVLRLNDRNSIGSIDLNGLSTGIYILKLTDDQSQGSKVFMVK
ncbi:MAG: fasciclin domain-containing protein [Saprospiraceae bacterium]|nr:fasciclin domain-containing protein [Saprospiraceae bacterium]